MQGDAHHLAEVLDAANIGLWSFDLATERAEWSTRMAELHRLDPAHRAGGEDDVFVAVAEEDQVDVRNALARARHATDVTSIEYRVRSGAGIEWVSLRLAPVEREGGGRVLAGLAVDATDRKQDEIRGARRRATVEALRWVLEAMIAGTALDDTAAGVIETACGVLGAEVGVVVHPEPGDVAEELTWHTCGFDDALELPEDPALPVGAFTDSRVSVVGDREGVPELTELLEAQGLPLERFASAMVVPIPGAGGAVIGHLLFGSARPDYFSADDAELAVSIASSTGVAIDNARRHEAQRLAARTFQQALLPDGPAHREGIQVCVRYHPGRSGVEIGGDWYDVIDLPDGRLGLAVGDVCGHGFTAAAHMSQLRHSFRALVQAAISPVEAFRVMNRMALDELHTTVTVAYVELDVGSGACRSWSCGHLPPMVAGPDRPAHWVDELGSQGPMLGFLDDLPADEVRWSSFELREGDTVLLYTDGLVERRGEDIDAGLHRLASGLGDAAGVLDDLCDDLYRDLADPGPEADDTALLAVRRTGAEPPEV